jgi:PhnB protein
MERHPDQGPTGGLTPHIQIGDKRAAEAIEWYTKAFGATEMRRQAASDSDPRLLHAHLIINGASLMLHDEFPEYVGPADVGAAGGSGLTLHLQVDDTDAWFDRAVKAGARAAMPPADMFWGDRYGQVVDPFGYRWSIGHPIKEEK